MRKVTALLMALVLVYCSIPVATAGNTGEIGPLMLQSPRPHYITIQLKDEQDSITLQEICDAAGDTYSENLACYYQDPATITVSGPDISNLTSIPYGQQGILYVYDWAGGDDGQGEWAIIVTFNPPAEKKKYVVTQTGTVSLAEILDAAGVTESTYDNYIPIKYDSDADYSAYLNVNLRDLTVTFLTTELPAAGCVFKLSANGGEPCPFLLKFIGDDDISNANDGILTYILDEKTGSAVISGFVSGLEDAQKANITIPESITWPKDSETTYTVTGTESRAFEGESSIETVTIQAPVFRIGNYAFYRCTGLKQVAQTAGGSGSKLTIGEHAFDAEGGITTSLESFTSKAGIDPIGQKAFAFL